MRMRTRSGCRPPAAIAAVGVLALLLAGCENSGGTTSPGVGTVAGAAAGAGASRVLFGNSAAGMLIGAAAGGLAGNMTLDRQGEERRRQEAAQAQQSNMNMQLEFERQRALQQEETRREIEEQRLFQQWQRERLASGA
jgi:hypothetical protein